MKNISNIEKTQRYSTWGDKLLQHADVLNSIQNDKKFKPITIQLAPTEVCDSDCPFCSVADRPIRSYLRFGKIKKILEDFKSLGAKSLEITGGGNPLLYKDKIEDKDINDIIIYAHSLGYSIGIITNSHNLKNIKSELFGCISWIRVSLIQLDEGISPEKYSFNGFPYEKLGFSYIIYDNMSGLPDELSRTGRVYAGTSAQTIKNIVKLVQLHPKIKFVRVAGDCLIKGNNQKIKNDYSEIINELDINKKFFIKDIGNDDGPYSDGCYVGLIRPYIAPNPLGGDYQIYLCTSHVLNRRVYDLDYSLGSVDDIIGIWERANDSYREKGYPYEVKGNNGSRWCESCKFCYYKFNNKILHTVAQEMPDRNFP